MSERLILKQSINTTAFFVHKISCIETCAFTEIKKESYTDNILTQVRVTGKYVRSLSSSGTVSAKKTRETINAAQSADANYLRKIPITLVDAIYSISCASQYTFFRGNCDRSDRSIGRWRRRRHTEIRSLLFLDEKGERA